MSGSDNYSKGLKPRVAFFDCAGCAGCQIELTNYGAEDFLELLKHKGVHLT